MLDAKRDHGRSAAGTLRFDTELRHGPVGRGFTLVELLVVVSIIALLISILLPSLSKARDHAKTVKCLAHQRGMAQAAMAFAGDHNGFFQLAATEGDNIVGVNSADPRRSVYEYDRAGEILSWPVAIARAAGVTYSTNWDWGVRANTFQEALLKQDRMSNGFPLAMCPADQVRISTPFYPRANGLRGEGDPNDPMTPDGGTSYWGYLSYGINEDIVGTETKIKNGKAWPACWKDGVIGEGSLYWYKAGMRLRGNMDRVVAPASCLLIVDAGPNTEAEALSGEYAVDHAQGLGYANLITSAQAFGPRLRNVVSKWLQRIPTKRHPGGAVGVTFADFHSATVQPTAWRPNGVLGENIPAKYSDAVRVSPYSPSVE